MHKPNTLYPGALDVGAMDAQQAESYSSHNQLNHNVRGAPRQRPAAAQNKPAGLHRQAIGCGKAPPIFIGGADGSDYFT